MKTDVLDHGFIRLVDWMGDDSAIVQAARVSYGAGTKSINDDRGLIRYLMRHRHSSPLEMCSMKFHCKVPIFVARQWIRHRTASINEISARYSILNDEFYIPETSVIALQSGTNGQGRGEGIEEDDALTVQGLLMQHSRRSYSLYEDLVQDPEEAGGLGVAREISRIALPTNIYTEFYWKCDLHNILHFLKLRMDSHAQYEIRVFADAMAEMVKERFPIAWEAFEDYVLHAVTFSRQEMAILHKMLSYSFDLKHFDLDELSKGEKLEFQNKLRRIAT